MFRSLPLHTTGEARKRALERWKTKFNYWRGRSPSNQYKKVQKSNTNLHSGDHMAFPSLAQRFWDRLGHFKRKNQGNDGDHLDASSATNPPLRGDEWKQNTKYRLRYVLPNPMMKQSPAVFQSKNQKMFQKFSLRFKAARENLKRIPKLGMRKSKVRITTEENPLLIRQSELSDTQISAQDLMKEEHGAQPEDGVVFVHRIPFLGYEFFSKFLIMGGGSFFGFVGTGLSYFSFASAALFPHFALGFFGGVLLGVPFMKSFTPEGVYRKAMKLIEKANTTHPTLTSIIQNENENGRVVHIANVPVDHLLEKFDKIHSEGKRMRIFEELQEIRDIYWTSNHYLWQIAEFGPGKRTTILRYNSAALVSRNQKILRNLNSCIKLLRNDPQCIV